MRSVPDQARAIPVIVYVTVDVPALNVTSPNSTAPDGSAANVMTRSDDEVKVMGAAKLQDPDVDAFVQAPEMVQEPPTTDTMKPEGLPTVTSPLTETFDARVVSAAFAPFSVSPPPIVKA